MFDIAEQALSIRIARSVEAIQRSFLDNLFYVVGRTLEDASPVDHYTALAFTIRDRLLARFVSSTERYRQSNARTVAYLSAEFLLGPHLGNNILNLDAWGNTMDHTREAMKNLGLDLDTILETELEPGLGNGGLGRLAACYMDSLATLEIPALGYGIRYEYGIFEQEIRDGWQFEIADAWLRNGNPWELPNRQIRYPVKMDGYIEHYTDDANQPQTRWNPATFIYGLAYARLSWVMACPTQICSGYGNPRRVSLSICGRLATAIIRARLATRSLPKISAKYFIPTMNPISARNYACASNISSLPARCRI
jgi:starch phosphorylase